MLISTGAGLWRKRAATHHAVKLLGFPIHTFVLGEMIFFFLFLLALFPNPICYEGGGP